MKNKFYQNLTELKLKQPKRIELGLIDDAKKLVKKGLELQRKMSSVHKPWSKIVSDYTKIFTKITKFLDETKGLTKNAEDTQKQANALSDKIAKEAKQLGVDVSSIPIVQLLDEVAVDLEDNITDIENARRQAKDA